MEMCYARKLKQIEGKERYRGELSDMFAALTILDAEV
jgi:hypothetical protein